MAGNLDTMGTRRRWAFGGSFSEFLSTSPDAILGALAGASQFADELAQKSAWLDQIRILKQLAAGLGERHGGIYFEYEIPRLGRRVDVILINDHIVYVIEFKVEAGTFDRAAIDQVWNYALDLKNFHEPSHATPLVPILVATRSETKPSVSGASKYRDKLASPLLCGDPRENEKSILERGNAESH